MQEKCGRSGAILSDLGLPVLSMKEAGVDLDIVEDGKTFAENAKSQGNRQCGSQTGGYRFSR